MTLKYAITEFKDDSLWMSVYAVILTVIISLIGGSWWPAPLGVCIGLGLKFAWDCSKSEPLKSGEVKR